MRPSAARASSRPEAPPQLLPSPPSSTTMAQQQQELRPIFDDIRRGDLEAVQQRVLAEEAVPAALTNWGSTPLIVASRDGHTNIVVFLLRLAAVKLSINTINQSQATALSIASCDGHQPIVQLLLDASADPTIPAGHRSPLKRALSNQRHAVAALLSHVITMADPARALHKVRSLVGAGAASLACLQGRLEQGQALPQVELTPLQQQHEALQCLQQVMLLRQQLQQQLEQALPQLQEHHHPLQQLSQHLQQKIQQKQYEKLQAIAVFAVGMSGGEKDSGLCEELYVEVLGYMLPAWADKGPNA